MQVLPHSDELPHVDHAVPLALRLVMIAAGAFAIVMPVWELGRALWPPTVIGIFFGVIVAGAASVGVAFIAIGVFGEAQRWRYEPHTLVIERRGWRSESRSRLTKRDIVSIGVRCLDDSDGPTTWRVCVVPRGQIIRPFVMQWRGQGNAAFETGDYLTVELARARRAALMSHLEMEDESGR